MQGRICYQRFTTRELPRRQQLRTKMGTPAEETCSGRDWSVRLLRPAAACFAQANGVHLWHHDVECITCTVWGASH